MVNWVRLIKTRSDCSTALILVENASPIDAQTSSDSNNKWITKKFFVCEQDDLTFGCNSGRLFFNHTIAWYGRASADICPHHPAVANYREKKGEDVDVAKIVNR